VQILEPQKIFKLHCLFFIMMFEGGVFSGVGLLIVSAIIILIWVMIELKRFRHKIFAIFLMILVLVFYFGAVKVFGNAQYDFSTPSGVIDGAKVYFSWLGSLFVNVKDITTHAIQKDWGGNSTRTS